MTTRDTSRYGATQTTFDDLAAFLASPITAGLNTIDYVGHPLDLCIDPVEGATTALVSFHPAVTNEKVTRPYFVGAGIFTALHAHRIYLSDPSLEISDELRLAWFAGNAEQRSLQDDITRIIGHVLSGLGAKHTIFVGTSGGGFASLYYSARAPGSLAFVVNPQTDIFRYHEHHVAAYAKRAWKIHAKEKARAVIPKRTTTAVLNLYSKDTGNSILYLQNSNDDFHIERHMRPLLEVLNPSVGFRAMLGEGWGPGHHHAPKELQAQLLQAAVDSNGDWARMWPSCFPEMVTREAALAATAG